MNHLPSGTLSPTITQYVWPNHTKVIGQVTPCVGVEQVKKELPVYDDFSDESIDRKVLSAQTRIEAFVNRDTTIRTRQSLWVVPARIIHLPFGKHEIEKVEQQTQFDGDYIETEQYSVIGDEFLSLVLQSQYPTRITYKSGYSSGDIDSIFIEAVVQETAYYFKNRNDPDEAPPLTYAGLSEITLNLLSGEVR